MNHPQLQLVNDTREFDDMVESYFPEILTLKSYYERNEWHNETIYLHVSKVFQNTLILLKRDKFKGVDAELLLYLAIYHDLGKSECFKINHNNTTSCPNHEILSLLLLPTNFKGILGNDRYRRLLKLIRCHSDIHAILDNKGDYIKFLEKYRILNGDVYTELVLFSIADILDGQLKHTNKIEYDFRMGVLSGQ